jgi:hypothetical protein
MSVLTIYITFITMNNLHRTEDHATSVLTVQMLNAYGNTVADEHADVAADDCDHFLLHCYGLVCHIPHVDV